MKKLGNVFAYLSEEGVCIMSGNDTSAFRDVDVIVIDGKPFVSEKHVCAVAYTIQKLSQLVGKPVMAYVSWDEELQKFTIDVDVSLDIANKLRNWVSNVGYYDYVHVGVITKFQKERLEKLFSVGGDKNGQV